MLELVILGLATWRISSLLVNEDGPWDLLGRLRDTLGVSYDELSRPVGENVIARALTCVWCVSPYLALAFYLAYQLIPGPTMVLGWILAISSIAIIVEEVANGPR
jgi:hypothetical protein